MNAPVTARYPGLKLLISMACLMIIIGGLKVAQSILVPFVLALFLAILGSAPVRVLKTWRVPKIIAVLFVALVMISILIGVGTLLAGTVNEFTKSLPQYSVRFDELQQEMFAWLQSKGVEVTSASFIETLRPESFMELIGSTLRGLVSTLSSTLLIFIIMVFMLFETADFEQKLKYAMGEAFDGERIKGIAVDIQKYLGIKTFTCILTGLFVSIFDFTMGIEFWLLWGFTAFLLNYVPFIGSFIAAVPAVILALTQFGLPIALTVAIGYLIINVGVSNFLEPIFMGRRLGLSPLVVFLSLVVWGWIWGPVGMLLSVPLSMVVKILLEHSEEFRWLAVLMGHSPKETVK